MRTFEAICEQEGISLAPELIRTKSASLFRSQELPLSIWESDNGWRMSNRQYSDGDWSIHAAIITAIGWLLAVTYSPEGWPWWTAIPVGLAAFSTIRLAWIIWERLGSRAKNTEIKMRYWLHCGTGENSIELFETEEAEEIRIVRTRIEEVLLDYARKQRA